jgi:dTDP-4-amino-4,6-dideoxygalactose transaminase
MTILLNKPVAPCLKTLTSYLEQINDSGWYTNFGPLHQKLTGRLEEYLGVENLLLVANGTLALHVAYRALDIKSAICTPFSFAATASSLAWEKIPFSFVDIDSESLNLSPSLVASALEKSNDIDSVIATHVYGNPCDVEAFDKLQKKYNVKVIYDGAHAFNVKCGQSSVLSFGDASTLSFHATKVFHTIEGGAAIFKDKDTFDRAKRIINFGLDAGGVPNQVGINAKLNEYQCAVGLTLLETMDEILDHRIELFNLYRRCLEGYVQLPLWNENASINGAYFPIILESEEHRRRVKSALQGSNIPSREYFSPSLNTIFSPQEDCPISESISSRILCLPIHFYLTARQVMKIVKIIKETER